ncbi:MAG TPA: response regulator [Candidatus Competibacter sp.]|nr:response regulator [Candidatus Competibacter sp.]
MATDSNILRVLLIEDSVDDALLLLHTLREAGYQVSHRQVETAPDLRAALDGQTWDIIISDYSLPNFDGLSALEIIRAQDKTTPFFFVSGTVEDGIGVKAMADGAQDYLMKDNLTRLAPALARELREAKSRRQNQIAAINYRNVLDTASDAIISVNEQWRIVIFNKGAETVFGYTADEALGQPLSLLLPDRFATIHDHHVRQFAQSGDTARKPSERHVALYGQRKDGSEFPAEINLSKVTVANQTTYTAILRDITERKAMEQELIQHRDTLEARVAERTAQLEMARQEAERLARVKSEFLANMSHEIRTPMNAVLGLAYLLTKQHLPEEARKLAQKIHSSGRTLLGIINDILDFSKIEAGRLEIEQVPFSLNEVLDNLATIMSANAAGKKLELIVSPPSAQIGQMRGDALRLSQVLINLTSNAIKFTEAGFVEVKVRVVDQDASRVSLRFVVRDSGMGINAAVQRQLFSPFAQADASTTRRFGGTGLGLAICRRLVNLMGGDIELTSAPGKGSTFWFTLCFDRLETHQDALCELAHLNILIADDNPITQEALAATAASLGWRYQLTDSGQETLRQVLSQKTLQGPHGVVLLDWKMPGLDGLAVASAIRNTLPKSCWPLLFIITAHDRDAVLAAPGGQQVDAVLNKPLGPAALYQAVAQAYTTRLEGTAAAEPLPQSQQRLAGLRVLVVDDSDINRDVAERILADEGAQVHLVDNGREAVDWLMAHSDAVDIVLMDVQMPVMDGYEATRIIRQQPALSRLPVVALTAGAFNDQQDAALAAGMSGFIPKPFDVDEAIARIRALTYSAYGGTRYALAECVPRAEPVIDLPDLDETRGLSIFKDPIIYKQYLRKFAQQYSGVESNLTGIDPTSASIMMHKMKGVAGNLGLNSVAAAAVAVEGLLHTGQDVTDALVRLRIALDTALKAVAAYAPLEPPEPVTQTIPCGLDQINGLLACILEALDADTPERVTPLLGKLSVLLPADRLIPLQSAVAHYDFRGAEAVTRTLAEELGITL